VDGLWVVSKGLYKYLFIISYELSDHIREKEPLFVLT